MFCWGSDWQPIVCRQWVKNRKWVKCRGSGRLQALLMAAAAPSPAPRAPKPTWHPSFQSTPKETPLCWSKMCVRWGCVSFLLLGHLGCQGWSQPPCWGGPGVCVTVIFTVCHCDPLMWGDSRDVPWSCWMPVVQNQSKKRKNLLLSTIDLSTQGLFW